MAAPQPPFTKDLLLICEGPEDAAFVRELSQHKAIPDFDYSCVGDYRSGRGIQGLRVHLEKITINPGLMNVKRIGLLFDSDDALSTNFSAVQNAIRHANSHRDVKRKYAVPDVPYVRKPAVGRGIAVTAILQPVGAQAGCLETLLWAKMIGTHPAKAPCVDTLVQCTGIAVGRDRWNAQQIAKAKVRAGIAVTNRANPARPLSYLWKNEPDIIPLNDPMFEPLVVELNKI